MDVNSKMSILPFATPNSGLAGAAFPIENSSYYQNWTEEKTEIERNKWYLSERVGHDVGWHYAQWDWIVHHRSRWLKTRNSGKI